MILGIDTNKFYDLADAKIALESVPIPTYGDQLHNIYYYEILPLVKIMEYLNTTDSNSGKLRFSDGQRNDDGIVTLNGTEQEIQFVTAIAGQQERIRMDHKKKFGRAPGVQDMKWEGTKNKRILPEQDTIAFATREILGKLRFLIEDAVKGKIKQQYRGMWLGVVFEDHILPVSNKTTQNYTEVCSRVMQGYTDKLKEIYPKVFFVGTSGRYVFRYNL